MSITICPTLDDYRSTFSELERRGLKFDAVRSVPLTGHENYVKQEWLWFWRISEIEYLQYNNESDEDDYKETF